MPLLGLLWELVKFDFKMYSRSPAALLWTFIFPLGLLGLSQLNVTAAIRADMSTVRIVDRDGGDLGAHYVEFAREYLNETRMVKLVDAAAPAGDGEPIDAVVVVPPGFTRSLNAHGRATLAIENHAPAAKIYILRSILQDMTDRFIVSLSDQALTLSWTQEDASAGSADVARGQDIMLGVIVVSMFSIAVFGFSLPLVRMRETGVATMRRLMPINEHLYFASFAFTRMMIMTLYGFVLLLVASYMLHVPFPLGLWTTSETLCVLLLAAVTFITIGLAIAAYSTNFSVALLVTNSAYFFMVSVGGIFFPIEGLPYWAREVVQRLPIRQVVELLKAVGTPNGAATGADPVLLLSVIVLILALTSVAPRGPFRGNF